MADNGWRNEPGVPVSPEKDGWHWVRWSHPHAEKQPHQWHASPGGWGPRRVCPNVYATDFYDGPCLTPTEQVAAVRAAVLAEREACAVVCIGLADQASTEAKTYADPREGSQDRAHARGARTCAIEIRARTTEDPGHG